MSCPTCTASDTEIERISKKRATHTAHLLAVKECERKITDKRIEYVDLYTTMFRRIYEHEYQRNMYVERERRDYNIRMTSSQWNDACGYHAEFDDDFCTETMKHVEWKYAHSKWPNPPPEHLHSPQLRKRTRDPVCRRLLFESDSKL